MIFVVKKSPTSISAPWLGSVSGTSTFFSLETFYRCPDAKQMVFYSIWEAQTFVRNHPDLCGTETVICQAKFAINGVTFEPVPAENIPPEPEKSHLATADDPDDGIPF